MYSSSLTVVVSILLSTTLLFGAVSTFGAGQLSVSSFCDGITQYLDDLGPKTGDIVDVSVGSVNRALVYPFFLDIAIPTSQVSVVSVAFADACAASGNTDCQDALPTPATTQRTIWMQSSTFVTATVLTTLRSAVPTSIGSFMSLSLGAVSRAQEATYPTTPSSTPSYLEKSTLPLASLGAATANSSLLGPTIGADTIQWAVTADTATLAAEQLQGSAIPYASQYLAALRGIRSSLAAGNVTVVGLQGRCDVSNGGALAPSSSTAFTATTPFQFIRGCSVAAVVQGIDDQYIYLQSAVGQEGATTKANAIAVLGYIPLQEFFTRWVISVPVAAGTVWSYSICTNCILSLRPSSVADTLLPPKRTASKPLSKYLRL